MKTTAKKPAKKAAKKAAKKTPARKKCTVQADEYGLSVRERKFADGFLAGMSATKAFTAAGYSAATAGVEACKALKKPSIQHYIKEQRRIDAEKNQIERWEIIGYLSRVLKTPVGKVDEDSDLAQEVIREEAGAEIMKSRVKMVDKMKAATQLCQMLGFNEPEQVKVTYEVVIGPGANE